MPWSDNTDAHELALFIINDGVLHARHTLPIIRNLARKVAADKYDAAKAPKAYSYLVDAGALEYVRQVAPGCDARELFSKSTRAATAAELVETYSDAVADLAADMRHGRRNKVTGELNAEPPCREFTVTVYDWSHDVNGNPTAHFAVPALGYETARRVQVGYGDKISAGLLGYLGDRFKGWQFHIAKTDGDRSAKLATLTLFATHAE